MSCTSWHILSQLGGAKSCPATSLYHFLCTFTSLPLRGLARFGQLVPSLLHFTSCQLLDALRCYLDQQLRKFLAAPEGPFGYWSYWQW